MKHWEPSDTTTSISTAVVAGREGSDKRRCKVNGHTYSPCLVSVGMPQAKEARVKTWSVELVYAGVHQLAAKCSSLKRNTAPCQL